MGDAASAKLLGVGPNCRRAPRRGPGSANQSRTGSVPYAGAANSAIRAIPGFS